MFFSLRGQPFDSEGGGLALFGNKYPGLEKAENKWSVLFWEKINNLTFTFLELGKTWHFFKKISARFARIGFILK